MHPALLVNIVELLIMLAYLNLCAVVSGLILWAAYDSMRYSEDYGQTMVLYVIGVLLCILHMLQGHVDGGYRVVD